MKTFEQFINDKSYRDIIIISEKFLNDEITEKEFENYFYTLNESFLDLKSKIIKWIDWFIKNIKNIGSKLDKYLKTIINIIITPLFKFKKTFATLALTLILSMSSMSVIGGNENDKVIVQDNIKASMSLLAKVYSASTNDQESVEIFKLSKEIMRLADENITNDTISKEYKETFDKVQRMIERYKQNDPETYSLLVQTGEKIIDDLNDFKNKKTEEVTKITPATNKTMEITGNPNLDDYKPEIQKIIKQTLKENNIKSNYIIGIGVSMDYNIANSKASTNVKMQINQQTGEKSQTGTMTTVRGNVRLIDYKVSQSYNKLSNGDYCFVYIVQN